MRKLEDYFRECRAVIPINAFLRISRTQGLFVSDLPTRSRDFVFDLDGYSSKTESGLLYITPAFNEVPLAIRELFPGIFKLSSSEQQKLLRQRLAVLKRNKDNDNAAYVEEILKTLSEGGNL